MSYGDPGKPGSGRGLGGNYGGGIGSAQGAPTGGGEGIRKAISDFSGWSDIKEGWQTFKGALSSAKDLSRQSAYKAQFGNSGARTAARKTGRAAAGFGGSGRIIEIDDQRANTTGASNTDPRAII